MRSDKKPLLSKDLTTLCRTELLQAGIGYAALRTVDKEPGGVGIRLLINNFEHKLVYECGLISDNASVKFLMGKSLQGDVTANHYRSFISPEGQARLYRYMQRDGRFAQINEIEDMYTVEVNEEGKEIITIQSPDPQRLAATTLSIRLRKDEKIYISAPCGVQGFINARGVKPDGSLKRK